MENLNNLPPFFVGQRVVATKNHSQGAFKIGQEFQIKAIWKDCCQWLVDVGITSSKETVRCTVCNDVRIKKSDIHPVGWSNFAPLQELKMKTLTFSEVMKEELISMN